MGLRSLNNKTGSTFTTNILQIKVSGPTDFNLTIVNLPGLISGSDDKQIVATLMDLYLQNPQIIIPAVIPTGSNAKTQPIILRVQKFNPDRT